MRWFLFSIGCILGVSINGYSENKVRSFDSFVYAMFSRILCRISTALAYSAVFQQYLEIHKFQSISKSICAKIEYSAITE